MSLTGKYYFEKTKKGMVLHVEENVTNHVYNGIDTDMMPCKRFRKAEEQDIPNIKVIVENGEE